MKFIDKNYVENINNLSSDTYILFEIYSESDFFDYKNFVLNSGFYNFAVNLLIDDYTNYDFMSLFKSIYNFSYRFDLGTVFIVSVNQGLVLNYIRQNNHSDVILDFRNGYITFNELSFFKNNYKGVDKLLNTGKPLIIAHPLAMGTDLNKVPSECYIEINNRYIWRFDWKKELSKFVNSFKFVFSSDAHQPNCLNQNVSQYVGEQLGIKETKIFS